MDADEFKRGLITLWGDPTWREHAPPAFDTTLSSLDRWAHGHAGVPGPAGRLMEQLLDARVRRERQRASERAYRDRKAGRTS